MAICFLTGHLPTDAQIILKLAAKNLTLRQIIENAPFGSYPVMKSAQKLLARGALALEPYEPERFSMESDLPDPLFADYKQALKKLINAADTLPKIEAIISFCKMYYNGILIFTAKQMEVVHYKVITIDKTGAPRQQSITTPIGRIESDPVFYAVYRSAVGFFGKKFSSSLVDRLAVDFTDGESALIPILIRSHISMFLYAHTNRHFSGLPPPTLPGTAVLDDCSSQKRPAVCRFRGNKRGHAFKRTAAHANRPAAGQRAAIRYPYSRSCDPDR